ncbi:MAG: efflux RND transporter permease subunit [Burkholderiaceae bacterium]|jgi:multidrug efflux pump subunit AcrB|nr:efflux RND transporter permease subunit [Burkholderiaceae bacterium]
MKLKQAFAQALNHEPVSARPKFNLSVWTLHHKALVTFFFVLVTVWGILSATQLAQSEDPPFTFRVMVIEARWPGADARQMQLQVTDRLTRKLQEIPHTDFIRSYSRPGQSMIFYTMKDSVPAKKVAAQWYEVRKRLGDIAHTLPTGVLPLGFNDEFGDVFISILTLQGDGFEPAQVHAYAEMLRTELLRVPGVAKVNYFGKQEERITVEIPNTRLSALGISPQQIAHQLAARNAVTAAGEVASADDIVQMRVTGQFQSLTELAQTLLVIDDRNVRLGDIAAIRRGYVDPQVMQMRQEEQPVVGIGITMQPDINVVALGKALSQRLEQLRTQLPVGLVLKEVSSMPRAVSKSVDEFTRSVAEAVVIVLLVSLFSLGVRMGMVVVISIPVVLAITTLLMHMFDIGLNKVSLGTLVLALGLLVDDAIIAIEMMAVKLAQGWPRARAAAFAYTSTAFPMLTGTLVTVSGFLPIALAKSATGEYTRAIFEVSAIALIASWLAAVTLIPLLGYWLLPEHKASAEHEGHGSVDVEHDVYDSRFYKRLNRLILWCVRRRFIVLGIATALFVLSLAGFTLVPKQFFPSSERPELLVDIRLQENASFEATLRVTQRLERVLKERAEIDHEVSFVGSGAPRFYLPLDQQLPAPNFAQMIVTAKSLKDRERLAQWLGQVLREQFSDVRTRIVRLETGPPAGYPLQFRVSGEDIETVHGIAQQVVQVMRGDPRTLDVQLDWDEPAARQVRFEIDDKKANALGLSAQDIASFLAMSLSGFTVSQYRESDRLIGIDLRAPKNERMDPSRLDALTLPSAQGPVPLTAVGRMRHELGYSVIWERDSQPTIVAQADVIAGIQGIDVAAALDEKLKDIQTALPPGYRIVAGGPIEENAKAQNSISAQMPFMVIAVLSLLMIQLQSFARVMMVVLTAPLGLIGVVAALLLLRQPFGFVALLGVIAMFGIIMRNSVILVDQIDQDVAAGRSRLEAIVGATVRRFRPITLTAAAAVLALIPLVRNNFFGPMATALMGGITGATILTLLYLPALYAVWFDVHGGDLGKPEAMDIQEAL